MGQGHRHEHADSKRRVRIALALIATFMLAEVVGGLLANSLALLADAGHMLTDVLALSLALVAFHLSERAPSNRHSFGLDRVQVLAAFVNGLVLLALAGWIVFEAVRRLLAPQPVVGPVVLVVGVLGLAVNVAAFLVLHGGDRHNMNLRGAALHVLSDMIGSVGAIVAALVIILTGWTAADPLLSLLVAALVLRLAWDLTRRATHVLLEATPEDLDLERVRQSLVEAVPGLQDVHHVHAWSLTTQRRLVTLHARVGAEAQTRPVVQAIREHLAREYGIHHVTVEIEQERAGPAAVPHSTGPATGRN